MESLLQFTIISLLLVMSPGPNGFLIFKTCLNKGVKHSFINIFGLVTATFLHGALSIFGLSTIIKNIPSLFLFIKTLGALYLCYIGIKSILEAIKSNKSINNKNLNTSYATKTKLMNSYAEGFFTQVLNPKVSIFYLAAFPLFIDFNLPNYIFWSFALVAIHATIIFLWFSLFTLLFKKITILFTGSKTIVKYLKALTGGILVYFGLLVLRQP